MEPSRNTILLYRVVMWVGIGLFAFGTLGTLWSAATFVQVRTGWGLTAFERCCLELGKASLGGMLASMFFVLIGSAAMLLLHPIRVQRARRTGAKPPRWLRWITVVLAIYSLGAFGLATVLAGMAEELEGFATGIVTYCMMIGAGMLASAWGFGRAARWNP